MGQPLAHITLGATAAHRRHWRAGDARQRRRIAGHHGLAQRHRAGARQAAQARGNGRVDGGLHALERGGLHHAHGSAQQAGHGGATGHALGLVDAGAEHRNHLGSLHRHRRHLGPARGGQCHGHRCGVGAAQTVGQRAKPRRRRALAPQGRHRGAAGTAARHPLRARGKGIGCRGQGVAERLCLVEHGVAARALVHKRQRLAQTGLCAAAVVDGRQARRNERRGEQAHALHRLDHVARGQLRVVGVLCRAPHANREAGRSPHIVLQAVGHGQAVVASHQIEPQLGAGVANAHGRQADGMAGRLFDDTRAQHQHAHRHDAGDGDLELGIHLEGPRCGAIGGAGVGGAARAGAGGQGALAGNGGQHARHVGPCFFKVLADKVAPGQQRPRRLVAFAELDLQLHRADREGRLAVKLRPGHDDARADGDRDGDLADPDVDRHAGADGRVGLDLEVERVEEHDAVGGKDHLRPRRAEARRHLHAHAGHDGLGRERKVGLALDRDERPHAPLQAEPRHLGVAGAPEARVKTAHRQHELAAVGSVEPDHEGKATRQPHIAVEQPRVVGELCLHPQHAFLRREARHQAQFERDQRHLWPRQRNARQAQQRDLQAVADLHRHHGHAVDQRKARERHAGSKPERAARHGEDLAQADQIGHGVGRRPRRRVERLDERELAKARQIGRQHEPAVDAQTAADAREKERRRPADQTVDRTERKERRKLLPVDAALAVAAIDRQAIDRKAAHQHADVLHVVAGAELAQTALDREPAQIGVEGQARQVDLPAAGVEDRGVGGHGEGQLQVIDRGRQAEQRHAPVEQERDAFKFVLAHRDAKTHLLHVDRPKAALHGQPPRPLPIAGAQPHQHRAGPVLLDRQRRAERGRQPLRAGAGVAEQALGHAITAARAARAAHAGRQVGQLQLHAARQRPAADLPEDVQRHRADRDTAGLQQRLFFARHADTQAVDRDAGLKGKRRHRGAHAEQVDHDALGQGAAGTADPARVVFDRDHHVARGQPGRACQRHPHAHQAALGASGRGLEADGERAVDRHARAGAGHVGQEALQPRQQARGVERRFDQLARARRLAQQHTAQQLLDRLGAGAAADLLGQQVADGRGAHHKARGQVEHGFQQTQRDAVERGVLTGGVDQHQVEPRAAGCGDQPACAHEPVTRQPQRQGDPGRAAHRRLPGHDHEARAQREAARRD